MYSEVLIRRRLVRPASVTPPVMLLLIWYAPASGADSPALTLTDAAGRH